MRWEAVFLLAAAYSFCQVVAKVPPKKVLCGMIVDYKVEEKCLQCFTAAGHISKHPEKVRLCTATYLPPDLAECSIPHADQSDAVRIHQGGGDYHHNHTNANFLPSCLTRRLRKLVNYQKRELMFVKQASGGIKNIMKSTLVEHGGSTMLSISAMASIIQLSAIKELVEKFASDCQDKYTSRLQHWERDLWEQTEEYKYVLADLMEEAEEEEEEEMKYDDEMEDNGLMMRSMRDAAGNNLPFGGTNSLAKRVMLYKCITSSLFESGAGPQLLEAVMQDDFFNPVPEWWVKPLLVIAKSAAEQNM